MHTISEMGTSVPAFLGKLWRLVEDPETDDLICWAPTGRSFFIRNQARFARELLPHYYKHNNMASFVRQLNMYGFHKKVSVELGGLKCDRDEMEFAHQYFCKDHPYLLDHIKRKIASNKSQDSSQQQIKPELMNRMLTEVRNMKGKQENFDSKLGAMKRENEALWRELALLRQKHHKQQQIVNKLIHFLVSLVNPNRNTGLGLKRRYPLMIDDANVQLLKQHKLSKVSKGQHSPTGPAIHELDASDPDLDSDYIVAEMLDNDTIPTIESPEHSMGEENMREYYVDEPTQIPQEIEITQNGHLNVSRKRSKGKKKGRKSKVPIKILIPTSENGEETREETVMLEVPTPTTAKVQVIPATVSRNRVKSNQAASNSVMSSTIAQPKPVPLATVRSSKLAAMAANMKKNTEPELDLDLESLQESSQEAETREDPLVKLENILIVPDITEDSSAEAEGYNSNVPSSVSSLSSAGTSNSPGDNSNNAEDRNSDIVADVSNGCFGKFDFMNATNNELDGINNSNANSSQQKPSSSPAKKSPKDSQNMSLSCVNQTNSNEPSFRLDMTEEMDNHIDTVHNDLQNFKEMLSNNNNFSIDANTLLGLFGTEDTMNPFGFPINPELDPQEGEMDDDHQMNDALGLQNKNENTMYNSGSSFLDFEDDMLLGTSSSSPAPNMVTDGTNKSPLELADNKGNIFDSLIANNNTSQT